MSPEEQGENENKSIGLGERGGRGGGGGEGRGSELAESATKPDKHVNCNLVLVYYIPYMYQYLSEESYLKG